MKRIGLICMATLACLSLAACGSKSSQSTNKQSSSSNKVVKHHKAQGANEKEQKRSQSTQSNSSTSSVSQTNQSFNNDRVGDTLNQPYKGYPTYRDYLNANGGDPDVQRQTNQMQTQYEIQNGYANPDGTPTAKGQSVIDAYNNGEFGN